VKIRELEEEHRRLEEERRRREEELKKALEEEARQKAEEERIRMAREEEAKINRQAEDAFAIIGDLDNALKGFTETLGLSDVIECMFSISHWGYYMYVHACAMCLHYTFVYVRSLNYSLKSYDNFLNLTKSY
jgi:hypothetical protein